MHEVKLSRRAVLGRVHVHRRDDDAVDDRHPAQGEGREHRRRRGRVAPGARREPALDAAQIRRVPQAQVLVADALTPRQQRVRELLGIHRDVALDVLEPFRRVAGGILQPQRLGHALVLIGREAPRERAAAGQHARERDRVLHGELGARSDRKMRGVRGVADEHDVLVKPLLVPHAHEGRPWRRQVPRVRHQAMALQPWREQRLAGRDRAVQIERVEARVPPRRFVALDDERRGLFVEAVAVRLEDAVLVLDEVERERVERKRRAEPDEPGRAARRGRAGSARRAGSGRRC